MKALNIKNKMLPIIGYLYLFIPVLIFCIGFLRWYFALLSVLSFVVLFFFVLKKMPEAELVLPKTKKEIVIFLLTIFVIVLLVLVSGIGYNGGQTQDLYWRNTIFSELVNEKWPASMEGVNSSGETVRVYLVYYIGFYMVPALFGKLFGLAIGFAFISVWAMIGLVIIYLCVLSYSRRIVILPMIIIMFFSGLDIFNKIITRPGDFIYPYNLGEYNYAFFLHLEVMLIGKNAFELSGFVTQLFWTFNNAIPMFVMMSLAFLANQRKNIIFLTSLIVLPSTLSCFGVAVIIICLFFLKENGDLSYRLIKSKEELVDNLKEYILNPGVILAAIVTLFTGSYVLSNSVASSSGGVSEPFNIIVPFSNWDEFVLYVVFLFTEVLLYAIFCFKNEKKNILFYVSIVTIIFFTTIRIGYKLDFMFKATTPFLFLLSLWFIKSLYVYRKESKKEMVVFGTMLFILSIPTSLVEIMRTWHLSIRYYFVNSVWSIFFLQTFAICLLFVGIFFIYSTTQKAGNTTVNRIMKCCIIPICSIVMLTLVIGVMTTNGMNAEVWAPNADAWKEIYGGENFGGYADSFFFKYFGKTF